MKHLRTHALALCILLVCVFCFPFEVSAAGQDMTTVFIDCGGGTYRGSDGYDTFNREMRAPAGSTLAAQGETMDRITQVGYDFRGWIAYDPVSGASLSGLMTTAELLNFIIPTQGVKFVGQWAAREGAPVTAITYAALYNGVGEVDYNVRVTLIHDGVRYSGNGFVTISKEIYSQWSKSVKVIWESPGEYFDGDGRWNPDYFDAEGPAWSFVKEKSCYISVSKTGKETERPGPRDVVNEMFYHARNVAPEISREVDASTAALVDPSGVLPAGHTITAVQYQSGSTYDRAVKTLNEVADSSNILLFDLEAKNAAGEAVHQLGGTVEVKIQLPADYVIQPGNTVSVYYLADDGTVEECETTYHTEEADGHYLLFKTDHFSTYAVAEVPAKPEPTPEPAPEPTPEPTPKPTPEPTEEPMPESAPNPTPEPSAQPEPAAKSAPVLPVVLISAGTLILAAIIFLLVKRRK